MSRKKIKKHIVVDTKDLLTGIQALTIYYEDKIGAFTIIKEEQGEDSPITQMALDELNTLGDILNFFTSLTGNQLKNEGEHFN